MYISDFKGAPFDVYNQGNTGNPNYSGTPTSLYNGYTGTAQGDTSYDSLVGSKWQTEFGQTLTFVSNSANAQVAGNLLQSSAQLTAFEKMAITVPSSVPATEGTFQVYVTNGSTVMKQDLFANGMLIVSAGTGIGQSLRIASHTGAAASTGYITVTLRDPIQTTLDATSKVSFVANPGAGVIQMPTTPTGLAVGVTLYAMPAATAPTWDGTSGAMLTAGIPQYGFVVSHGPVGCLIDNSVTGVGYPLGQKCATAGCLGIATLTTSPQIAISMQTLTSAEVGAVYMLL